MELLGGIICTGVALVWLRYELRQLRHNPAATLADAVWDYVLDAPYNVVMIFTLFCLGGYLLRDYVLAAAGS